MWLVAPPLSAALERGDPHRGGAAYRYSPAPLKGAPLTGRRACRAPCVRLRHDRRHDRWFWDEYPEALPTHVRRALGIDIRELKQEDGEFGIYLCGGSKIAGELIDEVDELVIKTYPLVLGSGMPMFGWDFALTEFTLEEVRTFKNGVLVRTYTRKR